jgi:hypothetical protein
MTEQELEIRLAKIYERTYFDMLGCGESDEAAEKWAREAVKRARGEWERREVTREIDEVVNGRRGWVALTKARAALVGIHHEFLLETARLRGLKVRPHGRYGWTGSRPA